MPGKKLRWLFKARYRNPIGVKNKGIIDPLIQCKQLRLAQFLAALITP